MFTSRDVFTNLWPISVARSRHQLMGSGDPIIGQYGALRNSKESAWSKPLRKLAAIREETENQHIILCLLRSVSLPSVKAWMEGTYDIPYKNHYFFVTTEPNQMEFSVIMQISSYRFIILEHIEIRPQFWKLLMLKVCLFDFIHLFIIIIYIYTGWPKNNGTAHTSTVIKI